MKHISTATMMAVIILFCSFGCIAPTYPPSIVLPPDASVQETLAAREIRRYVYLRTGQLLPMVETDIASETSGVIIGRKDRFVVRVSAGNADIESQTANLKPQEYLIRTIDRHGQRSVLIAGGDEIGTLYGAYRLAEHLGVGFFLHGDTIPDEQIPLEWPEVNEVGKPLFELRGIQPFHDFPEGPDWWDVDDYKAILSQLPKMRMNFFGLHTYPEGGVGPEPTVWIGLPEDVHDDGRVKFSYPARHFTTYNGTWGYKSKNTSLFPFGSAALYDRQDYGAFAMRGMTPWPPYDRASNELFNRLGYVLREAFTHARSIGIRTCVGTETPLVIPTPVKNRLLAAGQDPADEAVVRELYEGIFQRIARAYPLDYYWFWTPESWTWRSVTEERVQKTMRDMQLAIEAAKNVNAPFQLATCGWVLGPQHDRALFDDTLPKDMPMSCINRQVGKSPVEPGFARVTGRPQWAIPWLEDDPNIVSPQLWAGRMRRDAFDALRYGCNGLMGIHWRTRVLGPNVSALAKAAWDQTGWTDDVKKLVDTPCEEGAVGGKSASFPHAAIDATEDDPLYQTVRYGMTSYRIKVPDGQYTVTLKFCEPHYKAQNQRAFGVEIQGKRVLHKLDIFAKVGANKALDHSYKNIKVTGGPLTIDFMQRHEYPCISAIVVTGENFSRKINCGGPAYKDYEADLPACPSLPRSLPTDDFYTDWANCLFGPEAAADIAALFTKLDGQMPEPSTWVKGPGGIQPDGRPWEAAAKDYAFVNELAELRPQIQGAARLERFDYWLDNFRYMKAIAHVRCIWGAYNKAMAKVDAEKDAAAKRKLAGETALPLRKELIAALGDVYRYLLATITNTSEMGTVGNWAQHIDQMLLLEPGMKLAETLGQSLPADAMPGRKYQGPNRIAVPTLRTNLNADEPLKLKAIVLMQAPPKTVIFHWRPMGAAGSFNTIAMKHITRGVYSTELTPKQIQGQDIEYYVEAANEKAESVRFPASAPTLCQTVIVMPEGR